MVGKISGRVCSLHALPCRAKRMSLFYGGWYSLILRQRYRVSFNAVPLAHKRLICAMVGDFGKVEEVGGGGDQLTLWMQRIRSMKATARSVALEQLMRIDQEGAYAGLVGGSPRSNFTSQYVDVLDRDIPEPSKKDLLDPRERRQVTEIVSGVVRWQRRLHWTLINLPKQTNLDKMDVPLRILLYMAAYEILELRLAPHAINEYVELAKTVMHEGCGKVANGTLRALVRARQGNSLPALPKPTKSMNLRELADVLGITFSHPTWMIGRWLKHFGLKETVALLKSNNRRPAFSVRAKDADQLFKDLENLHVLSRNSEFLPDEFLVIESGLQQAIQAGILQDGRAQVQDEAAGLVVALLDPKPGDTILDCCAAPGGKALFAASRMRGMGEIIALDSVGSRLQALQRMAATQNLDSIIQCIPSDARLFCQNAAATGDTFDKVIVDAPCSGTGVLSKRADMRWRRKEIDMKVLCQLQTELLDYAAQVVAPNGILVYSTCSIEPEENERIVDKFLAQHPEFELEHGAPILNIKAKGCLNRRGMLQLFPHTHETDGAFGARLRRKMES